jgi:salicylate hydroxylase
VVKALSEATPNIRYYPNLAVGESLESWVFHDRITLIGDAAHAHGGAFATGGSLAIDDAYALYLAITSVFPVTATSQPTTQLISKSLHLYEKTRKPHADKLLGIVHKANASKASSIGTSFTDEFLRKRAANRPDTVWLHEHDVVQAFHNISRERSNI